MPADGLGLVAAKLTCKVGSQQWGNLLMRQIGGTLGREVFLLESEAGAIEQRLDGAFGHLQVSCDLSVAEVLQLAQRENKAVFLRQSLRDRPDTPACLVGFLNVDGIEAARGRWQVGHELVVVFAG